MITCKIAGRVALIVLILLTDGLFAISQCGAHGHVNGCSVPGDLPYFYKDHFKPACNKHDICYGCGEKYAISRTICDEQFKTDMKNICSTDQSVKNEPFCHAVVYDYHIAVRIGGSSHYESSSPSWCSDSWVLECLGIF